MMNNPHRHLWSYAAVIGMTDSRIFALTVAAIACGIIAFMCSCHARRHDHCFVRMMWFLTAAWAAGTNYFVATAVSLWKLPPAPGVGRPLVTLGILAFGVGLFYISYLSYAYFDDSSWLLVQLGAFLNARESVKRDNSVYKMSVTRIGDGRGRFQVGCSRSGGNALYRGLEVRSLASKTHR